MTWELVQFTGVHKTELTIVKIRYVKEVQRQDDNCEN